LSRRAPVVRSWVDRTVDVVFIANLRTLLVPRLRLAAFAEDDDAGRAGTPRSPGRRSPAVRNRALSRRPR
jgi:hypothetical protein